MRKKFYLTLDTETATLPFADMLAGNDAKLKQKISIAKPLVYDIGWVITDRKGNIIEKYNYLVQETFFVPNVFNTAYYKEKRPRYMGMFSRGEIKVACWGEIMEVLISCLERVDISCAYNATFDFKKAIPFTERYIEKLYSEDYNRWEANQKRICEKMINGEKGDKNEEYLKPFLWLRGKKYPFCDLWGLACDRLINIDKYRNMCLEKELWTDSIQFFKTSAEVSFMYLEKQYDFVESHTALDDAMIESVILTKALKKGAVNPYLKAFPFRDLGTTFDYALAKRKKDVPKLYEALAEYMETLRDDTAYYSKMNNYLAKLAF